MNSSSNVTYTKRLKKVIDARHKAEEMLKRAVASLHYVSLNVFDDKTAHEHIERSKELIISGNIVLKTITASEHIGEEHRESLEEACHFFKDALEEVEIVLAMVEKLKDQ